MALLDCQPSCGVACSNAVACPPDLMLPLVYHWCCMALMAVLSHQAMAQLACISPVAHRILSSDSMPPYPLLLALHARNGGHNFIETLALH